MRRFKTIVRTGREEPNANGHFVQTIHGATVAGPYASRFDAWAEEDRREREAMLSTTEVES